MKAAHFGLIDVNYRPKMVHLGEKNKWEKADFIDRKMLRNRVEHLDSRNLSSQYEKDIRSFNILSELANFMLLLWWSYLHEDCLQYEKHLDALTEASEDQVMTQITQSLSLLQSLVLNHKQIQSYSYMFIFNNIITNKVVKIRILYMIVVSRWES